MPLILSAELFAENCPMHPHYVGALKKPNLFLRGPLFNARAAHIQILLRRESLGLCWDYARR
jgi:hypothetical protein